MADFYTKQTDAVTHPTIVHELLKKIVIELGTREFRGGYKKPIINGGITFMDYVADSRSEFIQGVESLSDILLPQYDEEMNKHSEKYIKEIEIIEKEIEGKDVRMGDDTHAKLIRKKLKLARELFRQLNLLLKRTNYLKAKVYSEGEDDDDEDDEEDNEEDE